jgi:hypothetical protein
MSPRKIARLAWACALASWPSLAHAQEALGDAPQPPPEAAQPAVNDEDGDEATEPSLDLPDHDVTVSGTVRATPSQRRVGAQELRATPQRSAEDLLRVVPGLLLVEHANEGKGHQYYLRGFDAGHGSDVHGQGYLDIAFVIPEVVMGLEVTKGPFLVEQGNFATAGTVQLRLGVPGPQRGARVTVEAGSLPRQRASLVWAPQGEPTGNFLAAEAVRGDGVGVNREVARAGAMLQRELWRGPHEQRVEAMGAAYLGRFGLPGLAPYAPYASGARGFFEAYDRDGQGESRRLLGQAVWRQGKGAHESSVRLYGSYRSLSLNENFTGFLREPERGDRRHQTQEGLSGGLKGRAAWDLAEGLRLGGLGSLHVEGLSQAEDALDPQGEPWGENRAASILQGHGAAGAWLAWAPDDWWSLQAGGRLDVFAVQAEDELVSRQGQEVWFQPSPRLSGVVYWGDLSFFGAYGRGMRAPEGRSVVRQAGYVEGEDRDLYTGGDPDITTTDSAELGARWEPDELVSLGATAFGAWIERESVFDHVSGVNLELNGTQRLGLELDAQARPWPWLEASGDVSLIEGSFKASGAPIPGAPRWLGTAQLQAHDEARGLRAALRLRHIGARDLAHGAVAAPATVWDLTGAWRRGWFEVGLQLENLTDARWREGEYHFASWWARDQPRSQLPAIHYAPGEPLNARLSLTAWF